MSVLDAENVEQLAFDLFYIAMSDRCNLSCIMCSTTKHPAEYEEGMNEAELSLGQWKKIIDNIMRFKTGTISFGGGEPLLRERELSELVTMVASGDVEVNIVTNATLLTDNFLKTINQYKEKIVFILSVDGLAKETGYIRGKGVFEKVIAAAEILRQDNWRFIFTSVLMPQNFLGFIDFLKFAHEKFPEIPLEIQPVIPHNEIYYIREKFILSEEYLNALKNILVFLHEEGIPMSDPDLSLKKDTFLGLVENVDILWGELVRNEYVTVDGSILDKFKNLHDMSEMALNSPHVDKKPGIYSAILKIIKNQNKIKLTRPFGLTDLYWDYFSNSLHTNNQCKMGTKSFNINRRGNLWICGKELDYPLYQYKIEEIFNMQEYRDEMKRVEKCTSPCFAGLVV